MANPLKIRGLQYSHDLFFNGFPSSISLEPTNRCNLRCTHCSHTFRQKMHTGDIATEIFDALVPHLGREIRHISLNGLGEPLLSSQWNSLLKRCAVIEGLTVSFITNGIIPIEKADYLFSGKVSITFSIDGATKETYMKVRNADLFDKVIKNIKDIKRAKTELASPYPALSAIYVITSHNMHEMPLFVRLCGDLGIRQVFLTHLVAHDLQQLTQESAYFRQHSHDKYLTEAVKIARELGIETVHMGTFDRSLLEPNCPSDSWLYRANEGNIRCAMTKNWCMVTYAGHIQVCCAPDSLIAGDLREDSLLDIWNGSTYRRLKMGLIESFEKTCGDMCNLRQTITLSDIRAFYCKVKETYDYDPSLRVRQPYVVSVLNTQYVAAIDDLVCNLYDRTINRCEEIIHTEPLAFEAYNLKGIALGLQGKQGPAIDCFYKSLKVNREYDPALNNLRLLSLDNPIILTNTYFADLPEPFNYYKAILKSDHLHFGLWSENSTMEDAQNALFENLATLLPPPPAKLLDVGFGLGLSASILSKRGYDVTAIAPSEALVNYAKVKYGHGPVFLLADFMNDKELPPKADYDVLLFQESLQYLHPLQKVFNKAKGLLKDSGIIVLCDEVCYNPSIKSKTSVHMSSEIMLTLAECGFKVTHNEAIGNKVKPTCDYIIDFFTDNFDTITSLCGRPERLRFFLEGWQNQSQWYALGDMGYEVIVAKKDRFSIRTYQEGDEKAILPIFNKIFNVQRTMEHWQWKYKDNPWGNLKIALVVTSEGNLAAHYAGYPVIFYDTLTRQDITSFQIGDTMTVPEYRKIGLGKTGLLARLASYYYKRFCGDLPFIYGFNTGKIKKLGQMYLQYQYSSPVAYYKKDIKAMPFKKHGLLNRVLSPYVVKQVNDKLPKDWDQFFYMAAQHYRLLVKRDSTYIKWRYLSCPDQRHNIFAVYYKKTTVGFGAFSKKADCLTWGDALFIREHAHAIKVLLTTVINNDLFRDCSYIEGWFSDKAAPWFTEELLRIGFQRIPEPDDLYPGFVFFDKDFSPARMDNDLYYTKGDSDLF